MPLHPQAAAHLAATAGAPPVDTMSVEEVRRAIRGYLTLQHPAPSVTEVRHTYIVGPGSSLPLRIYRDGTPGGPVVLMLHGSGFVAADIEVSDEPARILARDTGYTVVTLDYRKAPENPYPAALDDAWAALEWLASGALDAPAAPHLEVEPTRIVVVGDSAGGTLAASLVQRARERGGPTIAAHAVLYPPLRRGGYVDLDPAEVALAPAEMDWFWDRYLPPGAPDGAVPLEGRDFTCLPPAFVATAEYDVLRADGERYAEVLRAAGVPTRHVEYPGTLHGFFWMDAVLDSARDLQRDLAAWITDTMRELGERAA
ncbi:alpha/beta hydrolase [Tsukamurella sp. 8F]|uniref:alpha/beta hydrolase n=1 Tax=Tsukamurella sp. 8F TaxID=3031961 RepID=UPI0023B897FD|nr:alpha/beta hydrolase [Tsukamurella sp. 8F]MDF0586099.1 alpha/beta hydrolase [Tsukamurella sp. 8F]